MTLTAVNPATGEAFGGYEQMTIEEAGGILDQVHKAFLMWKETRFSERARLMKEAARILEEKKPASAQLMAEEMGKPLRQGEAEIDKCRWVCEYYAENAERFLADEPVGTDAFRSFITFQPLGVVAAIMPWNFPFWQVFRFAAPNLMAGNAGLLKHAGNVPGCALAIEEIFVLAGFPEDLFRVLFLGSQDMDELLVKPKVSAATLTGSTRAGRAVAGKAGSVLKKTVLTGVEKGMPAYEEELFGPVAAIISASDEEEAIRKANDSVFGLGAAVFTRDRARGEAIASEQLEAGSCFVNSLVKSDPRLPFGGIKESGYGRELGKYGIREFVNIKTVWIE